MSPCLTCRPCGRSFSLQPDSVKGLSVCGTVYEDTHCKDQSEARRYHIYDAKQPFIFAMIPRKLKSPLVMLQNAGNSNFRIIYVYCTWSNKSWVLSTFFLKHVKYPSTLKKENPLIGVRANLKYMRQHVGTVSPSMRKLLFSLSGTMELPHFHTW